MKNKKKTKMFLRNFIVFFTNMENLRILGTPPLPSSPPPPNRVYVWYDTANDLANELRRESLVKTSFPFPNRFIR